MKNSELLTITATAFVLASCGSGETTLTTPAKQFAAAPTDVMIGALDGRALPARNYVLRDAYANGAVAPIDVESTYSYDPASQSVTLTIGDTSRTINLAGADANVTLAPDYAQTSFPKFTVFEVWFDTMDDFWNGVATPKFLIPISSYTENDGATHLDRSYGVVGRETPSSMLQAVGSAASYSGFFAIENYTQLNTDADDRHRLAGTLAINVDFAADRITSGQLNITTDALGVDADRTRSGSITIQSSSLDTTNNSFTSGLVSNAPGLTLQPDATITGGFYGNTAQEIGGTIAYDGVLDGKLVAAGGLFVGSKN